jgi:hypothetical protein
MTVLIFKLSVPMTGNKRDIGVFTAFLWNVSEHLPTILSFGQTRQSVVVLRKLDATVAQQVQYHHCSWVLQECMLNANTQ